MNLKSILILGAVLLVFVLVPLFWAAYKILVAPNHREYWNGNVGLFGNLSLFDTVQYVTLEIGTPRKHYSEDFAFWIDLPATGRVRLHELDVAKFEQNAPWVANARNLDRGWPLDAHRLQYGPVNFIVNEGELIGLIITVQAKDVGIRISRDAQTWFQFPLSQQDVDSLFGPGGQTRDRKMW